MNDHNPVSPPLGSGGIDSHHHLWKYNPVRDAWITAEMKQIRTDFMPYDLLKELGENSMDGSIAVQADQSETETGFLTGWADRSDFIKGVVGWVDLRGRYLPERLDFYSNCSKLKGFRHIVQAEPDDNFLLGEDFCRGIGLLKQYNFTYDILIYPRQLPAAIQFVQKFPEQKFVIDHLGKPLIKDKVLEPWASQMKEIAKSPNVYCKISGLVTEADWKTWKPEDFKPYLDLVFEAFGTGRLMFGSDWPVCLLAADYAAVKSILTDYISGLTAPDRAKIMGGNAAAFYSIQ